MPGTTTGEDRTAHSSSSHPSPTTPRPTSPVNRSSACPSSAASSTNTSGPLKRPGHTTGAILAPHRVAGPTGCELPVRAHDFVYRQTLEKRPVVSSRLNYDQLRSTGNGSGSSFILKLLA